ncbi:AmmeMemoRadiSam system protein B, partial [Candidatus Woesearchaeota archaeon]
MESNREPIVAGQFYPASFGELDRQIKECFEEHPLGPGAEPGKRKDRVKGVIAPHAGYAFSGPCAAWSYKAIAESEFPDAYLIIGLNHNGLESGFSSQDWATPFGIVKNHKPLTEALSEATGIGINNRIHAIEHSIEVQLPFLQYASRDNLAALRIVPLMIGSRIDFAETARRINETAERLKKRIVVIASSDFTHYGPAYGYVPFVTDIKHNMEKLDKGAVKFIADLDSRGFLEYIDQTGATICGRHPIALLIELLKEKTDKVLFEMYYTSGDVMGDYSNAVG